MMEKAKGFSLVELLTALTITLCLSAMMFQLFHQNERVFRDQTLVTEMQQTARIVASQIADEIRMAGQGVPIRAAAFDSNPTEATAVILGSSTADRVDFRIGLSNVETVFNGSVPLDMVMGSAASIPVADGSGFSSGKYVYLATGIVWLRAIVTIAGSMNLTVIPRETGSLSSVVHFSERPSISIDEAVSIYLNGNSVRRATTNDMSNPANPTWSAANELGRNCSRLMFTYYDGNGNPVLPTSLQNRLSIRRVDILLTVQTSTLLSDGTRPTFSVALRTIPRNVRIRSAN
jgi:hypothetical protein